MVPRAGIFPAELTALRAAGLVVAALIVVYAVARRRSLRNADFVKAMSREEQTVPQIRKVYELLVKQHPSYDEFAVIGDWAYARKVRHTAAGPVQTRRETIFVPRLRSPLARRALSLIRRKLERL